MRYEILNFKTPGGVLAQVAGLSTVHVRTEALPTIGLKELVTQVTLYSRPYDPNATVLAIPEISNDGQNWEARTGDQFTLSTPGTELKKQTVLGAQQRFDFQMTYLAPGSAVGGLNAQIVSIGRAEESWSGDSAPFEAFVEYLDRVRRGISATPPPGSGRVIPFWPADSALTSDDGTGAWRIIYTPMFPTHEYKKLIVQLVVDGFIGAQNTSSLTVYPISTVTGGLHVAEGASGFTPITTATTLPSDQTLDLSLFGGETGFELAFKDNGGLATPMGAHLSLYGIGVL